MPNSFLSKLIFYLHIKGNERRTQKHNPELSLCFSVPGILCTRKKSDKPLKSLREHCKEWKEKKKEGGGALFMPISRFQKSLRVACTLNVIIRPYLNFNVGQVKGVLNWIGILLFWSGDYRFGSGTDDVSKIQRKICVNGFALFGPFTAVFMKQLAGSKSDRWL